MLLSIANASPRNIESVRVQDLLPSSSVSGAKNLVDLLEYYYEYLNTSGLPTCEISSISSLKDIDSVSLKYIDQIKELIAKNIPSSRVLNSVELYRIIVKYYNDRGSEDSIHAFFRIFFNQIVEISYPKDQLFNLSGGEGSWVGDEWVYSDNKSFPSDDLKLFDGHYWQDYSYVIRSDLDSSVWYNDYLKFLHPAGLKLFSAIAIEIVLRNIWNNKLDYSPKNLDEDDSWMKSFIPPIPVGYHTPKYQPGYLRDTFLRFLFKYVFSEEDSNLLRLTLVSLRYVFDTVDVRNSFVREQYQFSEKFVDTLEIGAGLLDKTIEECEELYSNTNRCRFLAFSSIINLLSEFELSYYDIAGGIGEGDWSSSYYDIAGGDGEGAWEESFYEEVI